MDRYNGFAASHHHLDEVEIAFVVNLGTLRELLKHLSIDGRRWWIAGDPHDAIENGFIAVGHGDPGCVDRLNTVSFLMPVLTDMLPRAGTDRIVVLFDASCIIPQQPGLYVEDGHIVHDFLGDFDCFFRPIMNALIDRMRAAE